MTNFFTTFHFREIAVDVSIVVLSFSTSYFGINFLPSDYKSFSASLAVIASINLGAFSLAFYFGSVLAERLKTLFSLTGTVDKSGDHYLYSTMLAILQFLFLLCAYAYLFDLQLKVTLMLSGLISVFMGFCYSQENYYNSNVLTADKRLSKVYEHSISTYSQLFIFVGLAVLPTELLMVEYGYSFLQTEVFTTLIIGFVASLVLAKTIDTLIRKYRVRHRHSSSDQASRRRAFLNLIPVLIIICFGIFEDELARFMRNRDIKGNDFIMLLTAAGFIPMRIASFLIQEKTAINSALFGVAVISYYGSL
jgi:hypothetical protein